jgi:hypothetical protein
LTLLSTTGCVSTVMDSNKIIAVKTRCFGLIIETSTTSANATPTIKLGFVSQVIQIIPTSTNAPIYAPNYVDTFDLGQGLSPFNTKISEDTGTGNVVIGTNSASTYKLGSRFQPSK